MPSPNTNAEILMRRYLADRRQDLTDALGVCGSQLETVFAMAMLCAGDANGSFLRLSSPKLGRVAPIARGRGVALYAQFGEHIDGRHIRLDFAVFGPGVKFAVELDGHEYHDRTKEQARGDKSRDRLLTAAGWKPLRFTGAEVHANPGRCAHEVFGMTGLTPGVSASPPVISALCQVVEPDNVSVGVDSLEWLRAISDGARARHGLDTKTGESLAPRRKP